MNLFHEELSFLCNFIHIMESQKQITMESLGPWKFPHKPLYQEYIYTILDLRLIPEKKLGNYFQSQSDTNSLECGTIAMIYKY